MADRELPPVDRFLDLVIFKEQLRLVVRSNRSRTNQLWKKDEETPRKDRQLFRQDLSRLRHQIQRYKWDQSTVIELPTIPENSTTKGIFESSLLPGRKIYSSPSSQQHTAFPRLNATSQSTTQPPRLTSTTEDSLRHCKDLPELSSENPAIQISGAHYVASTNTPTPDLSLTRFREFVVAYNHDDNLEKPTLLAVGNSV